LDQLVTWVQVRTGKTFDERGELRAVPLAEWLQRWKDLQQQGNAWEPRPNAERWHRVCAREAEADQQWFAAHFHLRRLLQTNGESRDLRLRCAHAAAHLSRWTEALADYTHVLKTQPDNLAALSGRAIAQAELGRWEEAIKDLQRGLQLQPEDPQTWYRLGLAHLGRKDVKSYREHCRRMLQLFAKTPGARTANYVAYLGVVLPKAVPDLQPLVRLAELAYRSAPKNPVVGQHRCQPRFSLGF
jgi:tetratricopeptide (TPR) repeat protein